MKKTPAGMSPREYEAFVYGNQERTLLQVNLECDHPHLCNRDLVAENFQKGFFQGHTVVNEDEIQRYYVRNRACFGCPIYCSKISEVKEGKYRGAFVEGPEYECYSLEIKRLILLISRRYPPPLL
jgi:hypothetical protein